MTHDDEQRDNYIGKRTALHIAAIRAKLAAGDKQLVAQMDEAIGALLFDSVQWAGLIQSTAQGENAFAKLLDKAIADAAEILAIKDAEEVERNRALEAATERVESARLADALMRTVFPLPQYH